MAFWSGETLTDKGDKIFSPFSREQIDCNAYNLRMGGQYFTTAIRDEAANSLQRRMQLKDNESFLIPPGQFAFLLTKENVKIPVDAMAFISMRTSIKFQGLINVSGFHVDPGYEGKLVYAVFNASPSAIELSEGALVFKIWLCAMDRTSESPFIKQPGKGLNEITGDMLRGMDREILSLQSLGKKLRDQQSEVDRKFAEHRPVIENLTFIWRAITLAVIAAFAISLLTLTLPPLWTTGKAFSTKIASYFKQDRSSTSSTAPGNQLPSTLTKPP